MNPKFMIVDDDPDIVTLLSTMLQSLGCDTEEHTCGETALEVLSNPKRAAEFDAVFLDIVMPGLSGFAVLDRMREMPHTKEIPVIFTTAHSKNKEIMEGYASGAEYYLTKPFTKEQLIYALDMLLAEGGEAAQEQEKQLLVHTLDIESEEDEGDMGVMVMPGDSTKHKK